MIYRSDLPRCPTCATEATFYDCLWDYLHCANSHAWDGPLNDPVLRGCTIPSGRRIYPEEYDGITGRRIIHPNVLDPSMADRAALDTSLDDPNVSAAVAARTYTVLMRNGWTCDTLSATFSHPNVATHQHHWEACKITRQWLREGSAA